MKKIADLIIGEFFFFFMVIAMSLLAIFTVDFISIDGNGSRQMGLFLVALMSPIILIMANVKSTMTKGKIMQRVNILGCILIVGLGVMSMDWVKDQPKVYKDYNQEYSVFEIDDRILITYKYRYGADSLAKSEVFFQKDEFEFEHLTDIKLYKAYKLDMFGDTMIGSMCAKTDKMDNYKYAIR